MPIIRLTQKLQKECGIKPVDLVQVEESSAPFTEWYAHVFVLNRKKQVILVERQTLFAFTLEDVSRKDIRARLPELFIKRLGKALYIEGASGDVVAKVMDLCRGEFCYAKTESRRTIGAMNEFIKNHKFSYSYHGRSSEQRDRFIRYMPMRGFPDGAKKYGFPIDVFTNVINDQFGLEFATKKDEHFKNIFSDSALLLEANDGSSGEVFVFEVNMTFYDMDEVQHQIIRDLAVSGKESLAHLAESILQAYDFECDHCYGFYSHAMRKQGGPPKEVYELFVDIDDEAGDGHAKSVEKTKISTVFNEEGKQMLFLFDYGDCWEFIVGLKEVRCTRAAEKLPCVVRAIGEPPQQYPPYDEE